MVEKTLTELATKTRSVVEAANRAGVVRIIRKLRGGEWGGPGKGEEAACFVLGVEEYHRMRDALRVTEMADSLKNTGLE
jgi:hypothetical protein